jgi:FkbM family methyltransferase
VEALRYGSNVRESVRFAVRELAGRGQVASYRLRLSGLRCFVRHDGHDAWVLHEIFGKCVYAVPRPVVAVLGGAEQGPRVVDVGGHLGFFGLYVLSCFPAARITSFEPDPENAALLERTVQVNGLGSRWEVVRAAAFTSPTRVSFVAGLGERSHLTAAGDRNAMTVDAVDLFERLDAVDLLKLDIEGGEWAILADARFLDLSAPAIVLEYHSHQCPKPDPECAATMRLVEAGYEVISAAETPPPQPVGLLWALGAAATGRSREHSEGLRAYDASQNAPTEGPLLDRANRPRRDADGQDTRRHVVADPAPCAEDRVVPDGYRGQDGGAGADVAAPADRHRSNDAAA